MPDVDCGLCHASAIHISFTVSLFVSRQSWNPTSTRSIPITKNASTFVPFRKYVFTILHVNDRFFIICVRTLHHLFRCATSFIAQRFLFSICNEAIEHLWNDRNLRRTNVNGRHLLCLWYLVKNFTMHNNVICKSMFFKK